MPKPTKSGRPGRAFANVDVSDVERFADRLAEVGLRFDTVEKPAWLLKNGRMLESQIRSRMPVGNYTWSGSDEFGGGSTTSQLYGPLSKEFKQVEPGGFTFGTAFYWRFLEDGTVHIAPRGFVRRSINQVRRPAKQDAIDRLMRVLKGF